MLKINEAPNMALQAITSVTNQRRACTALAVFCFPATLGMSFFGCCYNDSALCCHKPTPKLSDVTLSQLNQFLKNMRYPDPSAVAKSADGPTVVGWQVKETLAQLTIAVASPNIPEDYREALREVSTLLTAKAKLETDADKELSTKPLVEHKESKEAPTLMTYR